MAITTKTKDNVAKVYNLLRIDANGDRTTYVGPEHTDVHNDKVVLTQRAPSPQKVYPGARKSSTKLIRSGLSKEAGVDVRRDMSCEISVSHTAGYKLEDVLALVLETANIMVDQEQAKAIVFTGTRP